MDESLPAAAHTKNAKIASRPTTLGNQAPNLILFTAPYAANPAMIKTITLKITAVDLDPTSRGEIFTVSRAVESKKVVVSEDFEPNPKANRDSRPITE